MAELIGMLLSRFPFYRQIAELCAVSIDGSIVPATGLTFIDELNVLLIAVVISGGIATTLNHIFCPEGFGLKSVIVSLLSSVVTIFAASYIFSGIAVWMAGNFVGRFLWPVLKILILVLVFGMFYLFVKAVAGLAEGEFKLGLFLFFALRAIVRTFAADVVCVVLLAMLI